MILFSYTSFTRLSEPNLPMHHGLEDKVAQSPLRETAKNPEIAYIFVFHFSFSNQPFSSHSNTSNPLYIVSGTQRTYSHEGFTNISYFSPFLSHFLFPSLLLTFLYLLFFSNQNNSTSSPFPSSNQLE